MAEYIEREALIAELDKPTQATGLFGAGIVLATDRAIAAVRCVPAADVEPVKRGLWKDNCDSYVCSNCGYETDNPNRNPCGSKRCPRCFAKMDGE